MKLFISILAISYALRSITYANASETSNSTQVEAKQLFTSSIKWVGIEPSETESADLLAAINVFETNGVDAGFDALEKFIQNNSQSAWNPALNVNMAEYYRTRGDYTLATTHWKLAWNETKASNDAAAQKLAVRALSGWTRLLASLGEKDQLNTLFAEADKLQLPLGVYSTTIDETKEGLVIMNAKPGASYRCGSFALGRVAMVLGMDKTLIKKLYDTESPDGGFRLSEVLALAKTNGMAMVAVRRPAGAEVVVPSIIHLKLNHYAAITQQKGNLYRVDDPTFEGHVWMDKKTIDAEASGEFIVPENKVPVNWPEVAPAECASIYGKGYPNCLGDLFDWPTDGCGGDDDSASSTCQPPSAGDGAGDGSNSSSNCPCGMPQWIVSEPYTTLWLRDVPLLYHQSSGTWMKLRLSYKSRGTAQDPTMGGFGDKWSCNWFGTLQSQSTNADTITDVRAGGGQEPFQTDGTLSYKSGRRFGGATMRGEADPPGIFMPNGAFNYYGLAIGDLLGNTNYFLTHRVDQYGRVLESFNFQTVGSLTLMTNSLDIDGRTNTLSYGNSSFPNLITAVTDPYGRVAHFNYNSAGLLTNIVDAQGMSTTFRYDSNENITNMTTPYGVTSFQYYSGRNTNDSNALIRSLLVTEATGDHQLYMYMDHPLTDFGDMASYHWNRAQFETISAVAQTNVLCVTNADCENASIKHWLHGDDMESGGLTASDSVDVTADAFDPNLGLRPNQIQYSYQGETEPYIGDAGALDRVTSISPDSNQAISFTRNSLGRATSFTYYGVDGIHGETQAVYTNLFDSSGTILLQEYGPQGELIRGYGYDPVLTNLLVSVTNAAGDVLRYTHNTNTLQVTSITFPGGLVRTNIYYTNGPSAGFLAIQEDIGFRTNYFTYTNGEVYIQTNELGLVTTNLYDNLNRLISTAYSDGSSISNIYNKLDIVAAKDRMNQWSYFGYNAIRQLLAETNVNGQVTTYDYCGCGALNQITRWNGLTPVTTAYDRNINGLVTIATFPDMYQLTYTYDKDERVSTVTDGNGNNVNVNWYQHGLQNQPQSLGLNGGQVFSRVFDQYGRLIQDEDRNFVTTTNAYDFLNRLVARRIIGSDGETVSGLESFGYSSLGLINYTNQLGNRTAFVRDSTGRVSAETNANGEVLQFSYNPAGETLALTDGKAQITHWNYDTFGHLTNKVDAAGNTNFVYRYDRLDRLTNRWTPAKGATVYRYDPIGNLTNVDYSGGTVATASITFGYDGLNRVVSMADGVGTTSFTWTPAGQLTSETGPWPDDGISYAYNSARQRVGLSLLQPNASPWVQTYTYEWMMRLSTISSPATVNATPFAYSYSGGGNRVQAISLPGEDMSVNNGYDYLQRLTTTELGGPSFQELQYSYNSGSEVTQQLFTAGNFINYNYDAIGQLKTAQGFEADGVTPRLQERFGYAYDKAWNLSQRTNNALVQSFSVNNLNELTSAGRSGTLTVAGFTTEVKGSIDGSSYGATNVTVSGTGLTSGPAQLYADGSWAQAGAILANGANSYTAMAQDTYGRADTTSLTANLLASVNYSYDLNGNLLSDGTRNFAYDDENQLVSVWVVNTWSNSFAYDGLFRKRLERDYRWNGSSWLEANEVHYVYDGKVVLQERDVNNLPVTTYTRGLDLSGTLQGAGGIGGLLARSDRTSVVPYILSAQNSSPNSAFNSYYLSDVNGNVTGLVAPTGVLLAHYQYDPFGNMLSMGGLMADVNKYRFSSKEWNSNAGIYCYGERFYDPNLQRWLNKDPIGEQGGINLFGFVFNDPMYWVDHYGECPNAGEGAEAEEGTAEAGLEETAGEGAAELGAADLGPIGLAALGGWSLGTLINDNTPVGNLGTWIGNLITPLNPPPPNNNNTPPVAAGVILPLDKGAREWARRNGFNPKAAQRAAHQIKQSDQMQRPLDKYGTDPESGDVVDPEKQPLGNLNDKFKPGC